MIRIPLKELADEKRLHLVEFREENDFFPLVVATPEHVRTKEELEPNEILDFEQVQTTYTSSTFKLQFIDIY